MRASTVIGNLKCECSHGGVKITSTLTPAAENRPLKPHTQTMLMRMDAVSKPTRILLGTSGLFFDSAYAE